MSHANVNTLETRFEESSIIKATVVKQQSLVGPERTKADVAAAGLNILNVVVGVAVVNLQGPKTSTFTFDIETYVTPNRAVVMLALMDIYNRSTATDMQYTLNDYSVSYVGTKVRVTGSIYVGDTDGFLQGLSYQCTVI